MSSLRHPVGPERPGVYWRRRATVVGVLLLIVVVVVLIVVGRGSGANSAEPSASASASASVSASASAVWNSPKSPKLSNDASCASSVRRDENVNGSEPLAAAESENGPKPSSCARVR